jgi:secreted trypsin-like serine protease
VFFCFRGDSGGPLATTTQPPILVGIVSWGARPCGTPAVYAKVSSVWYWIAFFCSVQKIPFEVIKIDAMP